MNWKKEFKRLNKDPEYLKELRKLDAEKYQILNAKLDELTSERVCMGDIIDELQTKLANAEKLLEQAWDAGYDNGREAEQGYIYTQSFDQWKKEKGLV
jgi:DNA-binding MarR family transcriptional regulator